MSEELDAVARTAVFEFLSEQERINGDRVLPRPLLERGIQVRGQRVPLMGPQGIFKPAVCQWPLSITTVPEVAGRARPYDDGVTYSGGILYRYRGDERDRNHRDNVGLRDAMRLRIPLVYFVGHRPGVYHAEWPVYVVEDDAQRGIFTVDPSQAVGIESAASLADAPQRAYAARLTWQRIHQSRFRELVLSAYGERCAICQLRHRELLDAAHILEDRDPASQPVVSNGLSLCQLHHAAYDGRLIGIRPDLVIEVRSDILEETDGPMLRHGLQGIHQQTLVVPRERALRPNADHLEARYEQFRRAG